MSTQVTKPTKIVRPAQVKPARRQRSRTASIPISEVILMALESLWSNRLRTSLTMLGVIIGIASVIAITSVGQGVQRATEQQIQSLGTNLLNIQSGASRTGGISLGGGSASTLTLDDARAIAAQAPSVQQVAPYLTRQRQATYGNTNTSTLLNGVDLNFPTVRNLTPRQGRYFTQDEVDTAKSVVVLGSKVCKDLFENSKSADPNCSANPIGQGVRLQGNLYQVIGVMESKGTTGGFDQDDQVYIPLLNMSSRIVGTNALKGISISGFWVKVTNEDEMEAAQFQVTNLLRLRHNIYPPQQLDDFRITNQADIISTFGNVVGLMTMMVGAIAAISLVVGGIGIANIMLVSVVERTREIGIRKAVGATKSAILSQFLTEAIIVSIVGGAIGIALGIAIAFAAANAFQFPFIISVLSVVAGFGLSAIVGLVAGVIPARNAARLDPIAALRSD
jgi:putative ABC transport system permease protein